VGLPARVQGTGDRRVPGEGNGPVLPPPRADHQDHAQIGRWRDYVHGDVVYIALRLTAKSLLAWLIFANVLRT
jgi:heliorhodopsin